MKRRWLAFCRRAGATARAEEAYAELDRRYGEPGRHYHTWVHVAACLRELRRVRPPMEAAVGEALELAVWFHDAVYEPGREDNEEASASLAVRWVSALGLDPALGERAAGLILATRHSRHRADAAEALLRDIDLAVLGACRPRYLRYERSIGREYARMPPERFREGRAELLRGLLARPELYATPRFRARLELRARRNLTRAIARLERRSGKSGGRPGS